MFRLSIWNYKNYHICELFVLDFNRVIEEDPAQVAKWQDRSRQARAQRDAESSGDETADGQSGVAGTSYIRHEPDARLQHNLVAIQDDIDTSSGSNFYLTDSDSDSGVFRPKIIEGGVSFPFFDGSGSIPDLLASAADYEMDVMNRMSSNKPLSNSMRGRSVSFSDIQQVISDDDRIGFENFSFGNEAVNPNANNNFQMRWDFQVGGNRSADDANGQNDNNTRDKGGGGLSGETNAWRHALPSPSSVENSQESPLPRLPANLADTYF